MISAFVKLLFACAQASPSDMDIVGELPVEVLSTILRYVDPESLVNAALVNRRWNSICKSDAVLRKRIHKRLRQERKARIEAYIKPSNTVKITRQENVSAVQFGVRNGNVSVQKLPVRYEAPKSTKGTQARTFKVSMKLNEKAAIKSKLKTNGRPSKNLRL